MVARILAIDIGPDRARVATAAVPGAPGAVLDVGDPRPLDVGLPSDVDRAAEVLGRALAVALSVGHGAPPELILVMPAGWDVDSFAVLAEVVGEAGIEECSAVSRRAAAASRVRTSTAARDPVVVVEVAARTTLTLVDGPITAAFEARVITSPGLEDVVDGDPTSVVERLVADVATQIGARSVSRIHVMGSALDDDALRRALVARLRSLGPPVTVDDDPVHAVVLGAAARGDEPVPAEVERSPAADPDGAIVPPPDEIQYTVYRPSRMRARVKYPLLLYVHVADEFIDPVTGAPTDPVEVVAALAERRLAAEPGRFGSVAADGFPLPVGAELTVTAWIEEGDVTPQQVSLRRIDPVEELEFRMRTRASPGRLVTGGVTVWHGSVVTGVVTFSIPVGENDLPDGMPARTTVNPFRNVFVSYSHYDRPIVDGTLAVLRATGNRYYQDIETLRVGERWEARLQELIREADAFQLFWSHEAMRSEQVWKELDYALRLGREHFILPVYWQRPRPTDPERGLPPASLDALHWYPLPHVDGGPQDSTAPTRTAGAAAAGGAPSTAAPLQRGPAPYARTPPPTGPWTPTPPRPAPSSGSPGSRGSGPPAYGAPRHGPPRYDRGAPPPRSAPPPPVPPRRAPAGRGPLVALVVVTILVVALGIVLGVLLLR